MIKAGLLIPLLVFTLAAQAPLANWDEVKALGAGKEVRVEQAGTHLLTSGRVQSVGSDVLVVTEADGKNQTFAKTDIARVSVMHKGHQVRNTLVGLGVGALFGFLFSAVGGWPPFLAFTLPGTLVGNLIPTDSAWDDVFGQ